jgi:FMN-dependent NADH-azoreductase
VGLPVVITVRNRVVEEFVKAKVHVIGNACRNVVSRAELIDKVDDLLHLGNRVVYRETGFVPGTGRLHLHNAS